MTNIGKLIAGALVPALVLVGGSAAAQDDIRSLRGDAPLPEAVPAPAVARQNTDSGRFQRAYRQQPPMIPHRIDRYQINLKVNQCLRCHDWPYSVKENAPKISETHYFDRDGVALDHIARTRWFCNQCHVPQVNAPSLLRNDFKAAFEVE